MEQLSAEALHAQNTRRWPRYQVDLPVRIIALNGVFTTPMMARGSNISRAGMALRASVALNPGDLMQLQFPTAEPSRVSAVVRHRNGNYMGLEFLSQLPPDDETKEHLGFPSTAASEAKISECTPESLFEGLRRKKEELSQLKKEIDILRLAALLLAEDEKESSTIPAPRPPVPSGTRPWPMQR
jgi:PilZ domain